MKSNKSPYAVALGVALALSVANVYAQSAPPATSPGTATVPPPVAESTFNAVWEFAGGAAERAALEAAVASTVAGLGWPIEGIARGRLSERNVIAQTLTLRVVGGQVEYTSAGRPTLRSPINGIAVSAVNSHGEPITLSTRVTGPVMVRVGQRPDGQRREVLRVTGDRLVIEATVSSPRLPRPLSYRLTYRRRAL
ncbi:MAG: hypothetical protein Q8Q09_13840 [Deltaproteobacteria bacterium]|nr:hypothetical protein [Deltaproteobacteria bacterium]